MMVLPFWTPLLPMLGISILKSFLQKHGICVKTYDSNVEEQFIFIHDNYFDKLQSFFPEDKKLHKNHLHNIGHNVLQNHMMAHMNTTNEEEYRELVRIIIQKTFHCILKDNKIQELKEILDSLFNELKNYVIKIVEEDKPAVLGLSVYNHTLPASIFAYKLLKESYPHIQTIMGGGVFSTTLPLNSPNLVNFLEKTRDYIDNIFVGPSEVLLLKYLKNELPLSQRLLVAADMPDGLPSLDDDIIPDFDDFNVRDYPYLAAYGSVGCPFNCSFCSETVLWGRFRKKKVNQIVREFKELSAKYDYQLFWMCDSLVNHFVTELAERMREENLSVYWDGYFRVDKRTKDLETCLKWRRGGLYKARMGIESGSQTILDLMDKRITTDEIKYTLSNLAYAGIKTTTYWVIGYPGETDEDFQQTLDLIEEVKDNIYEVMCEPFYYFYSGQVESDNWLKKNKPVLLYPQKYSDTLLTETWTIECEPSWDVILERVRIFIEHCNNKLGIPTPYSMREICDADERWRQLHKNAVPPLIDFMYKSNIEEHKTIYSDNNLLDALFDDGEFNFS